MSGLNNSIQHDIFNTVSMQKSNTGGYKESSLITSKSLNSSGTHGFNFEKPKFSVPFSSVSFFFSLEILVGNGKPTFLFIFEHNISAISAAALCIRIKWPPHFMNIYWLFAVFVRIFVYILKTQRVNKNDFADSYIYNVGTLLYVYNGNTVLNGSWRVRLTGVMTYISFIIHILITFLMMISYF